MGLGRIERMTPASRSSAGEDAEPATQGPEFVALDGSALENLEARLLQSSACTMLVDLPLHPLSLAAFLHVRPQHS